MNGSLNPDILRQQCAAVGKGFNDDNLGSLLWELVLIESKAGTIKPERFGVCSISYQSFLHMKKSKRFQQQKKPVLKAFDVSLDKINLDQISLSPEVSLIMTGAWFVSNVQRVPRKRKDQITLINRFWSNYTPSIYT